jgi:hypothetical protein
MSIVWTEVIVGLFPSLAKCSFTSVSDVDRAVVVCVAGTSPTPRWAALVDGRGWRLA